MKFRLMYYYALLQSIAIIVMFIFAPIFFLYLYFNSTNNIQEFVSFCGLVFILVLNIWFISKYSLEFLYWPGTVRALHIGLDIENRDKAQEIFKKIETRYPKIELLWVNWSYFYGAIGQWNKSLEISLHGINTIDKSRLYHKKFLAKLQYNAGGAYFELNNPDEGLKLIKQAINNSRKMRKLAESEPMLKDYRHLLF